LDSKEFRASLPAKSKLLQLDAMRIVAFFAYRIVSNTHEVN
jgi:hypothetical protein